MIDISKLKVGDKVHYVKPGSGETENGMVKSIPEDSIDSVRVVYSCAGEWENFMDYTSALTPLKFLREGWNHSGPATEGQD